MKITLIAAGIMFIPQRGWAPVETVVWEYNQALSRLGHSVQMINTRDTNEILTEINQFEPDVINLHCDEFANLLSDIKHPKKIATSHYPYIEQKEKHGPWAETFNSFVNGNFYIFCLSEGIKNTLEINIKSRTICWGASYLNCSSNSEKKINSFSLSCNSAARFFISSR